MFTIDFNTPIHVHFIGIGGISMSGLAKILLDRHFTVSGSDAHISDLTTELQQDGCIISYPQSADNITGDIDLVVYTAAIHPDNPELKAAVDAGIPTLTRAELLGQIMKNYHTAVNVAGTHGKTTTTSMITEILLAADADPTISVGGILNSIGGNIRVGHSFKLFTEKLPSDGTLIINSDIDNYEYFYKDTDCEVITFGSDPEKSMYSATNITYDKYGCCSYTLLINKEDSGTIELSVPGLHNVYNSLSAVAAAFKLGISIDNIKAGLKHFTGTNRRFEKKGEFNGVTVIDDYAHHPDEITATLNSAKNYPHNKIWCVFQPHTYSRTKALMPEFAKALSLADNIVLAKIYPARETDNLGISSADLMELIKAEGKDCYYYESFEDIEKFLLNNCINGDLLITMGAGDVYKIGEELLK